MLIPQGLHEERLVAVAIDKNKESQHALKWAADNLLSKGQKVTLLHVLQSSSSPPSPTPLATNELLTGQDSDNQSTDVFLPFRDFCSFKEVECDIITLEGHDIAKALIDYVSLYRVQNFVLGCPSKHGISRLFTKSDITNSVLKRAPDFCNVYIVSKGKISSTRLASHPLKSSIDKLQIPQRNFNYDGTNFMSPFARLSISENRTPADNHEFNVPKADRSFSNLERPSTDSNIFSDFNENLGSEAHFGRPSKSINFMDSKSGEPTSPDFSPTNLVRIDSTNDLLLSKEDSKEKSLSSKKIGELEEKMRRLELQTVQTMEMYHAACKEALREKQKLKEVENLRKETEKKLEEEMRQKEEALANVEKEKALRIALTEEAKIALNKAETEAQKRELLERKALTNSHEVKKIEEKYQSILRILVVFIIFYFYFYELR